MSEPSSAPIRALQKGLIVSCQAPADSPMYDPAVIAAMAQASVDRGAVGVRIDSPPHLEAVSRRVDVPVIGLWKQQIPGFDVYITPQFCHAAQVARAGADIIAIDATDRRRPAGETLESLIRRIHEDLGKPVMADVDTLEAAIAAERAGADLVGTTLYGYTAATRHLQPPGFDLLAEMVAQLQVPVICEGGVSSAQMARQAIDLGAFAVVVGTAITGVDLQVQAYHGAVTAETTPTRLLETSGSNQFALFDQAVPAYRALLDHQMQQYALEISAAAEFFTPPARQDVPLDIFLLDENERVLAGLVGYSRWNWLHIDLLWVEQTLRHQGYGSRLLQLAEQEARTRGCHYVRVGTLSFQARDFYEKSGYQVVGQLEDYPPGHTHYLLRKAIA